MKDHVHQRRGIGHRTLVVEEQVIFAAEAGDEFTAEQPLVGVDGEIVTVLDRQHGGVQAVFLPDMEVMILANTLQAFDKAAAFMYDPSDDDTPKSDEQHHRNHHALPEEGADDLIQAIKDSGVD